MLQEIYKHQFGEPLGVVVRVYYESVDGGLHATEAEVRARVGRLRLWREVREARAGFGGIPAHLLAVVVLDATRLARCGPLLLGLAAEADKEETCIYVAFIDAIALS